MLFSLGNKSKKYFSGGEFALDFDRRKTRRRCEGIMSQTMLAMSINVQLAPSHRLF